MHSELAALALSCVLLATATSGAPSGSAGLTIPLYRKSHGFEYVPGADHSARFAKRESTGLDTFLRHQMDLLSTKYGISTNSSTRRRGLEARAGVEPFYNSGYDAYYYGPVTVGGVDYNAVMDTGSADFWLANSQCGSSCTGAKLFDPSASGWTSSNSIFQIAYGTGETQGTSGTAALGMAGYNLTGQSVASCNQVSTNIVDENVSGIMGLGFSTISSANTVPFWQQLVQKNMLPQPLFAIQLSRSTSQVIASGLPGGSFTIGATDTSVYTGSVNFVSVQTPGYWEIPMAGVTVNGKAINIGTPSVAIDTGTSLVAGPSDSVAAVYAQIPGATAGTGSYSGSYLFPCTTNATVALTFGSTSYNINPTDLIAGQVSATMCAGGFIVNPVPAQQIAAGVPAWIIGDVFLKNVYTVFQASPAQVGFASLSGSTDSSAGVTTSAVIASASSVSTRGPVISGAATTKSTVTVTAGSPVTTSSSRSSSSSSSSSISSSTTISITSAAILSTLIAQSGAPSTFLSAVMSTPSTASSVISSGRRMIRPSILSPSRLLIAGVLLGAIILESMTSSEN